MNSPSKFIVPLLVGLFFLLGNMTFALIARLNLPIISVIIVTLFFSKTAARNWAIFIGLLYETISPYPILVMFIAIYACFAVAQIISRVYISYRTVLGSTVAGLAALFAYEIIIYILATIGQLWATGWRPSFSGAYLMFVGSRMLFGALILMLAFLIIRRFSAQTRGTIVQLSR